MKPCAWRRCGKSGLVAWKKPARRKELDWIWMLVGHTIFWSQLNNDIQMLRIERCFSGELDQIFGWTQAGEANPALLYVAEMRCPLTSVSERNGGMSETSKNVAQGSQLRDHKSVNRETWRVWPCQRLKQEAPHPIGGEKARKGRGVCVVWCDPMLSCSFD